MVYGCLCGGVGEAILLGMFGAAVLGWLKYALDRISKRHCCRCEGCHDRETG